MFKRFLISTFSCRYKDYLCWADPARDISVAFLNTGKSLAPEGFIGFANVTSTISAAFPVRK
jgi:hypothetical protein